MFCLPVLSAQLITAPTGRPSEMRNLAPADPPRPKMQNRRHKVIYQDHKTWLPDASLITACCMLQGFYIIPEQPLYAVPGIQLTYKNIRHAVGVIRNSWQR